MQTETVKTLRSKKNLNLIWAFTVLIIGGTLVTLLLIQPWNLPLNTDHVLDDVFTAMANLQSYRASYEVTEYQQTVSSIITEVGGNDLHHLIITIYFSTTYLPTSELTSELIVMGKDKYLKESPLGAQDLLIMTSDKISAGTLFIQEISESSRYLPNLNKLRKVTIDGVSCAHYIGTVDMGKWVDSYINTLSPTQSNYDMLINSAEKMREGSGEIEFWIDASNMLRQVVQRISSPGETPSSVTYRYSDFNALIVIEAPVDSSGGLLPEWELLQ